LATQTEGIRSISLCLVENTARRGVKVFSRRIRHGTEHGPMPRAAPHSTVRPRLRRFHAEIFHMHCIALRRRDAPCRAGSGVKEPLVRKRKPVRQQKDPRDARSHTHHVLYTKAGAHCDKSGMLIVTNGGRSSAELSRQHFRPSTRRGEFFSGPQFGESSR